MPSAVRSLVIGVLQEVSCHRPRKQKHGRQLPSGTQLCGVWDISRRQQSALEVGRHPLGTHPSTPTARPFVQRLESRQGPQSEHHVFQKNA